MLASVQVLLLTPEDRLLCLTSNSNLFITVCTAAEQSHKGVHHVLCACAALSPMPASLQSLCRLSIFSGMCPCGGMGGLPQVQRILQIICTADSSPDNAVGLTVVQTLFWNFAGYCCLALGLWKMTRL